jgi:hypothetical protein
MVMWRVLASFSNKGMIGGLEVVSSKALGLNVPLRARLALALELIDRYAPRLGARLRRDVGGIAFFEAGGTHWDPRMRAIVLDSRWAMASTIERLALTLVHEATHARCTSLGARYKGKERREETLCRRQEIAFADLLDPDQVRRPSFDSLNEPWWTRSAIDERLSEAVDVMGLPPAPFRLLRRVTNALGRGGA